MNTENRDTSRLLAEMASQSLKDEGLDIQRYFALYLSNWYWFAITLLISFSIAYGINRYSERTYSVSATLLIRDQQSGGGLTGMESIIPGTEIFRNQENLQNEIGILKSYDLNYKVIKDLPDFHVVYVAVGRRNIAETRLYKTSPFIVSFENTDNMSVSPRLNLKITGNTTYIISSNSDKDKYDTLQFGERCEFDGVTFKVNLRNPDTFVFDSEASNKYYFYFVNPAILANRYRSSLSVKPIADQSTLVSLSKSGYVREQEVDYLNKLMEVYMEDGLEQKNKIASRTIEFINDQLQYISDSLKNAENEMQNFRLKNSLVDMSTEGSIIQDKLLALENERTSALLKRDYYNYLLTYIKNRNQSGDIISPSVSGINDPILVNLIESFSSLQQQREELAFNMGSNLPVLSVIDERLDVNRQALLENVSSSLENTARVLGDIESRIATVEREIMALPVTERELIGIQRRYDLNNTVYTYLLEKRAEAGIALASNVSSSRRIDEALALNASRVKPNERRNNILAFIFGLLVPMVLIVIIDSLNNKIIDKKDVEKITSVPIIGYVSHSNYKTEIPVHERPKSTLAESFRSIRTALQYYAKGKTGSVVAVTSTISSEGKTFVSINLAAITAQLGKKVLLVGLDLRKPRIHRVLGISNSVGLSSYLIGESKLADIIIKTDIDNLYYTPAGPIPPNPAELIDSEEMDQFFSSVRKDFDYIIVDTPPLAVVTDTLLIGRVVDTNLFVVRQRFSSRNTISIIEDLYRSGRLKSPGIIINDINLTGYYGYGIRYGYTLGYGYNYGYGYYGQYSFKNFKGRSDNGDYYTENEV